MQCVHGDANNCRSTVVVMHSRFARRAAERVAEFKMSQKLWRGKEVVAELAAREGRPVNGR